MSYFEIPYKDTVLRVTMTPDNIHIDNSYMVKSKDDMTDVLHTIYVKSDGDDDLITRIPMETMIREWRAHNLLYALGIARKKTKAVDLNENNWFLTACYYILSLLYCR